MLVKMRSRLGAIVALGVAGTLCAHAADDQRLATIDRIIDEGFNHSELAETAAYLTDRIGGRLTNSPQMRAAEQWTQQQFSAWGLKNVHTEGFEFGRGWSIEQASARLVVPRVKEYRTIPIAWTPGTSAVLRSTIVVAPLAKESDFAQWRGKLKGQIVLVTRPDDGSEPTEPPFKRLTDQELAKLDEYRQPNQPPQSDIEKRLQEAMFEAQRDAFLAAEGAVAWVRKSYRDGGLLHGDGYMHRTDQQAKLPGFELAAEDYRQLARLAKTDAAPQLELNSVVKFYDDDHNAYNILADIPGRDAKAGYVMSGAHLDSWVASDGAQDNAAGSAVVMEAARILSKLNLKPRRTIRFALWSGEEQGIYGSANYVERHLVERAPLPAEYQKYPGYYTWNLRWPLKAGPDYDKLSVYFNIDNGSGKVRGIHAEGNVAAVPLFREWLAPFASMGATAVVSQPTGGTDHVPMQMVGIPGFQFVQDPLDYGSRIHHSSVDAFDHLKMQDLRQAAVILASMLWQSAEHESALPRMPLPRKPKQTDPFSYGKDVVDDE